MSPLDTITAEEIADALGINYKTVYEYAQRGAIPHVRLGRRVIFSRVAITEWFTSTNTGRALPAKSR